MKHTVFLVLFFLSFASGSFAQIPDSDSLERVLKPVIKSEKHFDDLKNPLSGSNVKDSVIVKRFLDNAGRCENENPDSVLFYSNKALNYSIKIKWLKTISLSLQYIGDHLISKNRYPEAMRFISLALEAEELRKDEIRKADLMDEIATVYYHQEIYPKSKQYYTSAYNIYVKAHDSAKLAMIYSHMGNLEGAREYCEKRTDEQKEADFLGAIEYLKKSVDICTKMGNRARVIHGNLNIAAMYNKLNQPEKALPLIEKALDYYKANDDDNMVASTLFTLGITYKMKGEFAKAISTFQDVLRYSDVSGNKEGKVWVYEKIAETYKDAGDYRSALDNYITFIMMRDSIFSAEKSQQIIELETKYDTAKKEQQIESLTYQKKVRNIVLISLAVLLATLAAVAFTITRNLKARKKLAEQNLIIKEQKIAELEKERQLIATKAVLHGEETERKRMAHDLHDGLGGLLSGVKINLWNMKENAVISSDNITAFNQALGLLDNSIQELRRIAHNLMPETLMHYGLRTALQDFVNQLPAGKCKISYHSYGNEFRYQNDIELAAYRITQELVNNALKYSEAAKIDIQLFLEESRLSVQVSDNGKGFDTAVLNENLEGKGLQSIRNRVTMLKGKFEISSTVGEGTEAIIEFSVL